MKLLSTFFWALASITTVSAVKDTMSCRTDTTSYSSVQTYDCVVTARCECVNEQVSCWPPNALCAQLCHCVEEIPTPPRYESPPRYEAEVTNKPNFVKKYCKKWWAAGKKLLKKAHHKRMLLEQQEYARQLYARAVRAQELLGL